MILRVKHLRKILAEAPDNAKVYVNDTKLVSVEIDKDTNGKPIVLLWGSEPNLGAEGD